MFLCIEQPWFFVQKELVNPQPYYSIPHATSFQKMHIIWTVQFSHKKSSPSELCKVMEAHFKKKGLAESLSPITLAVIMFVVYLKYTENREFVNKWLLFCFFPGNFPISNKEDQALSNITTSSFRIETWLKIIILTSRSCNLEVTKPLFPLITFSLFYCIGTKSQIDFKWNIKIAWFKLSISKKMWAFRHSVASTYVIKFRILFE